MFFPVLFVSLRDLQWRRRRFFIGVLAAGLVFALTLLMSGVSASFGSEVKRTVAAFEVDSWIVPTGVSGPFSSARVFQDSEAAKVAALPGVEAAEPVLLMRTTVEAGGVKDLSLVGSAPGGLISPELADGRAVAAPGEIVVDKSLGLATGSTLRALGREFKIVGRTQGITYFAGTPVAFLPLTDLQTGSLGGAALATTVVVKGSVASAPNGYHVVSNAAVRDDLSRPMKSATQTIVFISILLWVVAAGIIGSILYLQAIERSGDFAVFKATGVKTRTLLSGLAFQAVALALCSAVAAYVLSFLLTPMMSMVVDVPVSAYVLLPVVAVLVGLLSSLVALRRAVTVDPALAFGG